MFLVFAGIAFSSCFMIFLAKHIHLTKILLIFGGINSDLR